MHKPVPAIAAGLDLISAAAPAAEPVHLPDPLPPTTFSFSQLEEYLDCPERYRLRHVVGLPTPAHHSLSYGRALHAAVAWFHLQVAHGAMPSEAALIDEFRRAWLPEGFLSREHEAARFAAGIRSLAQFRASQLQQPAPVVAVERPFELDLGGVRIRGRMDRLDRDESGAVIIDYKSSDVRAQKRADEKARESLQLQVYAMAYQHQTGELPREMQLHFLDSGLIGHVAPQPARLERARDALAGAAAGIYAGEFAARPNPVACGYCPFRQLCPSSAA